MLRLGAAHGADNSAGREETRSVGADTLARALTSPPAPNWASLLAPDSDSFGAEPKLGATEGAWLPSFCTA